MVVQCNNRLRGRTAMVLQADCSHSEWFIAENCRQTAKVPVVSWACGAGVTND